MHRLISFANFKNKPLALHKVELTAGSGCPYKEGHVVSFCFPLNSCFQIVFVMPAACWSLFYFLPAIMISVGRVAKIIIHGV